MQNIKTEIVEASVKHTATLIFLHGLGDTGHGWASLLKEIAPKHTKIICPHAPAIPVTLNGSMVMPSWYDLHGLSPECKQDEAGIKSASQMLDKLVDEEVRQGIPAERVVLGGFSQGGAVALYTGLTGARPKYGGLLCLSTWLPLHTQFQSNPGLATGHKTMPVFQCHGGSDPMVPVPMGKMTSQFLQMLGFTKVTFKVYSSLGHSSSDEEMKDVGVFVNEILPSV